jgi:hypothetical protein
MGLEAEADGAMFGCPPDISVTSRPSSHEPCFADKAARDSRLQHHQRMEAGAGGPPAAQEQDVAEVAAVSDSLQQLVQATARLHQLRQWQTEVLVLRDAAMAELHQQGNSYADIARAAGTTRGRVAQIVRAQRRVGRSAPRRS